MKLLFTIIIALLCITMPSYAQDGSNISELFTQNEFSTDSDNDLLFVCRASTNETDLSNVWKPSVLIDYKNKAHHVEGHYNIAKDEIHILLQNQARTVFPQKIKAVKVGEMIFVPCEFEGQASLAYGYFQVLSSNKIDLLKRFENEKGMLVKAFYTRKKDEIAQFIKLNKNSLLKYLDDKQTTKYVNDKKLSIKKEEVLILLFNYYNRFDE